MAPLPVCRTRAMSTGRAVGSQIPGVSSEYFTFDTKNRRYLGPTKCCALSLQPSSALCTRATKLFLPRDPSEAGKQATAIRAGNHPACGLHTTSASIDLLHGLVDL